MPSPSKYLLSFKKILLEKKENVSEIEMTSGNYDNEGNLITEKISTITTDWCEIGIYHDIIYFTFVIYSESYNKNSFNLLKDFSNVQFYGFKDFKTILYPTSNFEYKHFEQKIKKDKYIQINFNYNPNKLPINELHNEYINIREKIKKSAIRIVNQLLIDLTKEN